MIEQQDGWFVVNVEDARWTQRARALRAWDFLHCPPGVSHVLIGAGDGPCAVLAIGHRKGEAEHELFYPHDPRAREYGAEAPEPTPDPRVAYSDVEPRVECDPSTWPLAEN